MILYPLESADSTNLKSDSAWAAVERAQRQPAQDWWLVAQPDHAALAGDLASLMSSPLLPSLDERVIEAIRLHDEGWNQFDRGVPLTNSGGRPLSFFDFPTPDTLLAWDGSIERAQKSSAIGGILVREHFCRIGRFALQEKVYLPEDEQLMRDFLSRETERQARVMREQRRSLEEIAALVDVLQLCDLISLYLCCGSRESVTFPQSFAGQNFRAYRDGELCRTQPSLFGSGASLSVAARRFPSGEGASLPLLIE